MEVVIRSRHDRYIRDGSADQTIGWYVKKYKYWTTSQTASLRALRRVVGWSLAGRFAGVVLVITLTL